MTAIAIAAYLVFAFYVWTRLYRWLYRFHRRQFEILEWERSDRAFGIIWGGCVALAWPLSLPIFGLIALANSPALNGVFERLERD